MIERSGISDLIRTGAIVLTAALASSAVACNSITGVGGLRIGDDATTSSSSSSSSPGAGGNVGAGGDVGVGVGVGGDVGVGGNKNDAGTPVQCAYPTTGFSTGVDGVIAPSTNWQGYAEHSDVVSTINIADFYDCDGSKNINALLIEESAVWCPSCNAEASELGSKLAGPWAELGIHVLTLIIEDASGNAATPKTALAWKTKYNLDAGAIGVDPDITFFPAGAGSVGLPLQILVDPRTMKIIHVSQGFSGDYTSIEALAKKNKTSM